MKYSIPLPPAPKRSDPAYNPKPTFLQRLSQKKMEEFKAANDKAYHDAYRRWENECSAIQEQNRKLAEQSDGE